MMLLCKACAGELLFRARFAVRALSVAANALGELAEARGGMASVGRRLFTAMSC